MKDISDIVLKAVRAAESEARSANTPDEAVKAAGDAAAELVKSAALEVWKRTSLKCIAEIASQHLFRIVYRLGLSIDVIHFCRFGKVKVMVMRLY